MWRIRSDQHGRRDIIMREFLLSLLLLGLIQTTFAIQCYNCQGCNNSSDLLPKDIQDGCVVCVKKLRITPPTVLERQCAQSCPADVDMIGFRNECCTLDLCNTANRQLIALPIVIFASLLWSMGY